MAWLAQEQILFDGARLRRDLEVTMAPDASLTLVESVVFGRLAMGESIAAGCFRDRWRVRRGGQLVLAEEVALQGRVSDILNRPAVGGGARALATFLHVAPDAEAQLERVRDGLAGASCECGATALPGMVLARFLSANPLALRTDLATFVAGFRREPMPRSWQT